ncbi:MAG TPA: hypothetical protein PK876_04360 [Elusimicrobiota bacterium]|nr:hypothetical protein [Elusimicrobiota bacterium]
MDDFSKGLLVGLLIGEGHFGGDGKQPHVTLRMHARHETLFKWLVKNVPGSRLYGPYHHSGRNYYQWMVRGEVLRRFLIPLLDSIPLGDLDAHASRRYADMKSKYGISASVDKMSA